MTSNTQPEAAKVQAPAAGMRGEIQTKWGRFSAQEIAALKDKHDLVAQVQTKYQLDKNSGAERCRRVRKRSAALVARSC